MIEGVNPAHPLSLYIHIPFCKVKCGYCAFYSLPEKACTGTDLDAFYHTLTKQLEALVWSYGKPFETIFIGGGNPGMLGFSRLKALLESAQRNGKSKEVTIEINPEYVNEEIFTLSDVLTRVSVGLQSFSDTNLKILSRQATKEINLSALSILDEGRRRFGWKINGDLITCIPGEGVKDTLCDIATLIDAVHPDHISLYALTFEEGTRLSSESVPEDEELQVAELTAAWDYLEKRGYEQYEVSNFALGGAYCAHNIVYWNLGQYIGLGPSAEGSVGYEEVISLREKDTLDGYLEDPSFDALHLDSSECAEEVLLTSLRTKWGIDKKSYKARFGVSFDEQYGEEIASLDPECYINDESHFALTRKGFMILDNIILTLALSLTC